MRKETELTEIRYPTLFEHIYYIYNECCYEGWIIVVYCDAM